MDHLIGYKLSFYRNIFNLDQRVYFNLATARLSVNTLDQASLCISNLITLLNLRTNQCVIDNFNQNQIDTMIVYLSTD